MPTQQNAQKCAIKKRIVFCESPIVLAGFMQQPTSDAHSSTYLISAKFDGIAYTCVYIYIYTVYITEYSVDLYMFGYLEAAAASMTFVFFHKWFLTNKV